MNTFSYGSHPVAVFACLGVAFAATGACAADDSIDGRIHRVRGDHLEVCFDGSHTPHGGEHVQVIRHALMFSPKGAETMKSTTTGSAEIDSTDGGRCAGAHLVDGDARALDWVATRP